MSVDDSKSSFLYMWFYNPDGLRSTAGWSFQLGEAAGSGQEQADIITVSLSWSAEVSQRAQGAAAEGREWSIVARGTREVEGCWGAKEKVPPICKTGHSYFLSCLIKSGALSKLISG